MVVEEGLGAEIRSMDMTFDMDTTLPTKIRGAKSRSGNNQTLKRKKIKQDNEIIGSRMMSKYLQFGGDSQGRLDWTKKFT